MAIGAVSARPDRYMVTVVSSDDDQTGPWPATVVSSIQALGRMAAFGRNGIAPVATTGGGIRGANRPWRSASAITNLIRTMARMGQGAALGPKLGTTGGSLGRLGHSLLGDHQPHAISHMRSATICPSATCDGPAATGAMVGLF